MLQVFRKFFHSSVGVFAALGLIVMLALAFAAGDVSNMISSGSITGGDRVAKVGGTTIGTAQLTKQMQQAVEITRQQQPGVTMKSFLAEGGLDLVLDQMIDGEAQMAFGRKVGIIAGKRLIDSELAKIPAFQGAGGKFDQNAYLSVLAQRQMNDADVRDSFARDLVSRQLLAPAQFGAALPQSAVVQYASLLKEHRSGLAAMLPSSAFAPKGLPTQAEVAAWYNNHKAAYAVPERRVIRYARFDESVIKQSSAPTEAEVAARFKANAAQYAASETRKVSQVIVISESMAKDIAAAVAKGESLEAAAKAKGLSVASLGAVSKADLTIKSSAAVAEAAYAAKVGATAGPVKGALGWALVRVDAIDAKPARTLEQVKGEITAALTEEKRKQALAALTEKVNDDFGKGGALSDTAKELGLTMAETPLLTAKTPAGMGLPAELASILPAAFGMDHEGQPQISELVAGKSFVIFDVTKIIPAAPAPLDQISAQVMADIQLEKGSVAARAAAMKLLAAGKKGSDLAAEVAKLGVALPPVQQMNLGREEIMSRGGQIPPAVAMFFGMAPGTTKLIPIAGNRGFMAVQLKTITPGTVAANDPLVGQVKGELNNLAAREQAESLRRAIRTEVKVERNESTIKTVTGQLAGGN
ncbi:peptidyl-prolyl cis-trans isomerase [Novosphingobium sp. KACC 22771]|uniref:peptidyl-prolyl cis-trans isomerase n=1 Tax=Novosphingobium sp. KACC 22771 TaxID=3025670 RepID=UPI00236513C8|nr:peptidyl-prolyl cis-trans isomerase [Novosphingobium sp. KACC 22771]WDF71817.1 SurA N-terminal domain-containing protein [Novosphingobium sp. KACC 22771]